MKKGLQLLLLLVFALTTLFIGCSSSETSNQLEERENEGRQEEDITTDEEAETAYFPLVITDAVGNEITMENEPEAIISLMPSVTETIYAVGAGDKLIARSDWCNYPEQVLELPSVGQMAFDLETLLSLKPDLVLAHEGGLYEAGHLLDQVRDAGITVVVVNNSDDFAGIYSAIELVAAVAGHSENGDALVTDLKTSFTEIEKKVSEIPADNVRTAWLEVDPLLWTTGKGTFMNEILEMLNVTNIAAEAEGWVQFSEEEIVISNPDIIIVTYGAYVENWHQQILERAGWSTITAIETEQLIEVDSDRLSRPGPRLAEGIEELATLIYPEVFNN